MEADYSKRELDEHFKDINARFDKQDIVLREIKDTGKATDTKVGIQNGRVAKLETWKTGLIMAGIAVVFLFGIIMSLIVYSFQLSQQNLKSDILLQLKK